MRSSAIWLVVFVLPVLTMGYAGEPDTTGPSSKATPAAEGEFANSIGMRFKLIPAREYMMGSRGGDRRDSRPLHHVRITKPYYLGVYEVTQSEYERVMGENPSHFKGPTRPVERVSWHMAVEFCRKLSAKEGRTYRLPTEAEWEYACRAGTKTPFAFGGTLSSKTDANFNGNYTYGRSQTGPNLGQTSPVGSYRANDRGLYDMHGNVWEWCADWYDSGYYEVSPRDNPKGPASGSRRVRRGGCWYYSPGICRSAYRTGDAPANRYSGTGFRVVLVPAE